VGDAAPFLWFPPPRENLRAGRSRNADNDAMSEHGVPDLHSHRLRLTVDRAEPLLKAMADVSGRRPAPGTWSPREVIGHLIDSASHNHQRFVRARWTNDLVFLGYEQDRWVEAQHYQDAPWHELVALWANYNRHVARVMEAVPVEVRTRPHTRHNLHETAWREYDARATVTLDEFMDDYVDHLEHHLRQVLGPEWASR
jgi:hypothetical protein